jgi:hypothetical protein
VLLPLSIPQPAADDQDGSAQDQLERALKNVVDAATIKTIMDAAERGDAGRDGDHREPDRRCTRKEGGESVTDLLLKELDVTDFRSIRGHVHAPLDAKVVLVHGENGAGKTSLLSAIELALTGSVQSLRRADRNMRRN